MLLVNGQMGEFQLLGNRAVAQHLTVVADVAADSNPRCACARLESAPTTPVLNPNRVSQLVPRFNEVLPIAHRGIQIHIGSLGKQKELAQTAWLGLTSPSIRLQI
jgi:hypothetical protein